MSKEKDIDYFSESSMDRRISIFYNGLPLNLRDKLANSLGYTDISGREKVLQGYEKSDIGAGLSYIRFWHGQSKGLNFLPILGSICFGITRAVEDTAWHDLYFDSKTGECLSHDKNTAASKLNENGIALLGNGKFEEAKEYFSNAYHHSSNSTDSTKFANSRDAANIAAEAQKLLKEGKYSEAQVKFHEAYNTETGNKQAYADARHSAAIASEAQNLLKDGKFSEAASRFQKAADESTASEIKNIILNCKNATDLAKTGQERLKEGKFSEAVTKFQEALKYSNTDEFHALKNDAEARVRVKDGETKFNQGKYEEALAKFQEALQYSNTEEFHAYKNKAAALVYDQNGYNSSGYNSSGYNAQGRNSQGKTKEEVATENEAKEKATTEEEAIKKAKEEIVEQRDEEEENINQSKESLRIDSSYQSTKDVQEKAQDAIDKAAREEAARKKTIEKAVKEEEALKKAEEEKNINQSLAHLQDGVTCLQEGKTELAENNFDEALEACNRAERHFGNANHQKLLNILSECYINLITLYNEAGDSSAAQDLCRKCSKNMFINSKYATTFEDISINMQASDQMQLINFISGMHIHPAEEIAYQVIQLIGSQSFGE